MDLAGTMLMHDAVVINNSERRWGKGAFLLPYSGEGTGMGGTGKYLQRSGSDGDGSDNGAHTVPT